MKGVLCVVAACACLAGQQEPTSPTRPQLPDVEDERLAEEPGAKVAERVRSGGRFETSRYRRTDDGVLEFDYIADIGGSHTGSPRWVPLCGDEFDFGLGNTDLLGFVTLLYHGPHELLAMTDGAFHLERCGYDPSDIGLRQMLPTPLPADPVARRVAILDRMVAIDVLLRRGCRNARPELTALAKGGQPAALRERARRALVALDDRAAPVPIPRRRLAAADLRVPKAYDLSLVVDHARLPDLSWLAAGRRQLSCEQISGMLETFGRPTTAAMRNGCQRVIDSAAELPFALTERFGDVRIDHSALFFLDGSNDRRPFDIAWQAVGSFEPERYRDAQLPATVRGDAWQDGKLDVTAEAATGTLGKVAFADAAAATAVAARVLGRRPAAIHVTMPETSSLWSAFAGAPKPTRATLTVDFAPTAVAELRFRASDEVEAWRTFAGGLDHTLVAMIDGVIPEGARDTAHDKLVRSLQGIEVATDGDDVVARCSLPTLTSADLLELLRFARPRR